MNGSPFLRPRRNPSLLGPGPNLPEELPVQSGSSQIMKQTGDLILADKLDPMTQLDPHSRAHARRSHRMGPVVAANGLSWMKRVRIIVQFHQLGKERTRDQ